MVSTRAQPVSPGWKRHPRLLVALAIGMVVALVAAFLALRSGGDSAMADVGVLEREVELQVGRSAFRAAQDGDQVTRGDVVRTDASGQAEITWWEGSVTRLDVRTTFAIDDLVDDPGRREAEGKLEVGRVWNRVSRLSGSDERFEINSPNATAAVRGTAFIVDCRFLPDCTFTVVEGRVEIITRSGQRMLLEAGDSVTVGPEGQLGNRRSVSGEDLLRDPWVVENLQRDGVESVLGTPVSAGSDAEDEPSPESTEGTSSVRVDVPDDRAPGVAGTTTQAAPAPPSTRTGETTAPSSVSGTGDGGSGSGGGGGGTGPGNGGGTDPGNGKIVYVDEDRIWVLAAEGGRREIAGPPESLAGGYSSPRWSPDGTMLAWLEPDGARSRVLVVAAADGSGRRIVVDGFMCASAPAWSPDGSMIASSQCTIDTEGRPQLFTVPVGGGEPTEIPTPRGASAPSFSPDGTQLVFADRPDPETYPSGLDPRNEWDLGVVALDGSGYRLIGAGRPQQDRWEPAGPVWSPAGGEIAYFFEASSSTCARHVRIINTDGTGEREVAAPDQEATICERELPSWNADGSMLVFSYCDVGTETTPPACHLGVAGSEPGAAARSILQLSETGVGYPDWHGRTVPGSG